MLTEWSEKLDSYGIDFAPVSAMLQAMKQMETPSGPMPVVRSPFLIDGAEIHPRGPAPFLGENPEAVLIEASYSQEEVARLRNGGAFGR